MSAASVTELKARMAVRIPMANLATGQQLFRHLQSAMNLTRCSPRSASFRASSAPSSSPTARKLVLYSKSGCCLCDGLKEKLDAAFTLAGPNSLNDVQLQVTNSIFDYSFLPFCSGNLNFGFVYSVK